MAVLTSGDTPAASAAPSPQQWHTDQVVVTHLAGQSLLERRCAACTTRAPAAGRTATSARRERRLPEFVDRYFDAFAGAPVSAPVDLARHLVWGAVEYARGLGFEPHPDLRKAAGHLGTLTDPCAIGFGRDGMPVYVQGPHDDVDQILFTLDRTVGTGNYHFLIGADAFEIV